MVLFYVANIFMHFIVFRYSEDNETHLEFVFLHTFVIFAIFFIENEIILLLSLGFLLLSVIFFLRKIFIGYCKIDVEMKDDKECKESKFIRSCVRCVQSIEEYDNDELLYLAVGYLSINLVILLGIIWSQLRKVLN